MAKKTKQETDFRSIKTFDDACKAIGFTEEDFNKKWTALNLPEDTLNYEKLKIIAKAINQDWVPDWNNSNQCKWYPFFRMSSGFGFSSSHYSYGGAHAAVGSRLCFKTEEKAIYVGKQFTGVYKKFLTLNS